MANSHRRGACPPPASGFLAAKDACPLMYRDEPDAIDTPVQLVEFPDSQGRPDRQNVQPGMLISVRIKQDIFGNPFRFIAASELHNSRSQ